MSPGKSKNRDSKLSFDAKKGFDGKSKIILFAFLFFILFNFSLHAAAVVCTPASAIICAAVDDIADIYINGIYLATFGYVDVSLTGKVSPKCMNLNAAEINSLMPTGNVIAVRDQNTAHSEVWATWSMDISCQTGQHTYVDSDSGSNVHYWYDTNVCCNPTATPVGTPMACDLGPNDGTYTWYNPLFTENASWTSASNIVYLGQEYGQKIFSFQYHTVLPPLGYGGVGDGCMQLYYRQGFNLNVIATPAPPNMTITKSANKTLAMGPNDIISFSFHICNTGGGTTNTVGTNDNWTDAASNWQYQGPWGILYGVSQGGFYYGDISEGAVNGPPAAPVVFYNGFPGVTCTGCTTPCFDYTWILESWNIVSCITWYNSVTLTWTTGQASSGVTLSNFCSPTFTYTLTYTITPTSTFTPTFTRSLTMSPTPTLSPQLTLTNSPPVTRTFTPTPTLTPTYTNTPPMQIALTKTISSNVVMLGDNVTYCLNYYNTGSSSATINLWDTIPAVTNFVSCTGGCSTTVFGSDNVVWWSGLVIAAGANASVCFTVQVVSTPYLIDDKEWFALIDNKAQFAYTDKRLNLIEPEKRICLMIEISRGSP